MIDLDPERVAVATERADALRADAEDLRNEARAKIAKAEQLERTWGIHPPCHLCGRRNDCGH